MNTIPIYDDITPATTLQVRTALARNPTAPVTVRINSPGGSPIEATTIHNLRKRIVEPCGLLSRALPPAPRSCLVALATALAPSNAIFMIHGGWTQQRRHRPPLAESADAVEKISDGMARIIAAKTHRPLTEMRRLLSDGDDHWLTADEALAPGLINEVTPELAIAARLGSPQLPERFHNMTDLNFAPTPPPLSASASLPLPSSFKLPAPAAILPPELAALENEPIDSGASSTRPASG
ncbi:MAG: ATP-dependent Clp protease proteolytic subunit [Chromatiaceae bacterium]|nr:ATP-dependent Clp protease proteolytic subunit [Chromatiaceae bacterium]